MSSYQHTRFETQIKVQWINSEWTSTCVHDDVGCVWSHVRNHLGADSLGELFHHNLNETCDVLWCIEKSFKYSAESVLHTCSLGGNPDETSTSLALPPSLRGVCAKVVCWTLFSLSSCPSDGEPSSISALLVDLVAVLELGVLGALLLSALRPSSGGGGKNRKDY